MYSKSSALFSRTLPVEPASSNCHTSGSFGKVSGRTEKILKCNKNYSIKTTAIQIIYVHKNLLAFSMVL